jgi:LmbE family N-acetylglucosaminyl deacetylase
MKRILLLVPHPDDEVVGCAAAIGRARAAGAQFYALYLTTGLPAPDAGWPWRRGDHQARISRRRDEALAVAAAMGIQPLAFCPCPARQLRAHLAEERLMICDLVTRHGIEGLWVPAYEGGHQDHDATNFLASTLASALPVIEFAEYTAWPRVRSQAFPFPRGTETTFLLDDDEVATKTALLAQYRSERGNLAHVRCQQEALRPLPRYDYRRPPHPGRLFYQRFQWIPLRHPRVDFTSPADVCRAFARFAAPGAQKGWFDGRVSAV